MQSMFQVANIFKGLANGDVVPLLAVLFGNLPNACLKIIQKMEEKIVLKMCKFERRNADNEFCV